MHDHADKAAPWEEKFLPKGAIAEICIRVFIYENDFVEEVMVERIGSAFDAVCTDATKIQGAQKDNERVAVRKGIDDKIEGTEYEWFFEPIQE